MTPRKPPPVCVRCGKRASSTVRVSFRGLCSQCSERAVTRSLRSLAGHAGPDYELYVERRSAALRRELAQLDAQTPERGSAQMPASYRKPRHDGD